MVSPDPKKVLIG